MHPAIAFGDNNPIVLFVKFSPNVDAHLLDLPFNTAEEQMYLRLVKQSIGEKESVAITNLVKCMTQDSTHRQKRESASACISNFEYEMNILKPKGIAFLGNDSEELCLRYYRPKVPHKTFPSLHKMLMAGVKTNQATFKEIREFFELCKNQEQ